MEEAFSFSRLVLVVGILQDKDALGMLQELYERFGDDVSDLCLTQSSSPRAIPAGELGQLALDAGWPEEDLYATESLPDALEWAVGRSEAVDSLDAGDPGLNAGTGGGVLVTGSITVIAEVRELLGAGAVETAPAQDQARGGLGTVDVLAPDLGDLDELDLGLGLDQDDEDSDLFGEDTADEQDDEDHEEERR